MNERKTSASFAPLRSLRMNRGSDPRLRDLAADLGSTQLECDPVEHGVDVLVAVLRAEGRFCDAMLSIHHEIQSIENKQMDAADNPLTNAPHTQLDLVGDWNHPYSRETAAFPSGAQWHSKFWSAVNRIDNVYGDRNLFCSCPMPDEWQLEDSGS